MLDRVYKAKLKTLRERYISQFRLEADQIKLRNHIEFVSEASNQELLDYVSNGGLVQVSTYNLEKFIEESTNWYFEIFSKEDSDFSDVLLNNDQKGTLKYLKIKDTPLFRRRFKSKLRLVLNFMEGKFEESGNNVYTRIPFEWYKRYVGRSSSGSNVDFDMIETLLTAKGLLSFKSNYIPPYRSEDRTITKSGLAKTYWVNMEMYDHIMQGDKVLIEMEASELRQRRTDIANLPEERKEVILNLVRYNPGEEDFDILEDKLDGVSNNKYHLQSYQKRLLESLLIKDLYVLLRNTTDNYGGRFYTLMTQMKSEMRKNLRYKYEETVELDLSSAQMTILAGFISSKLNKRTTISRLCSDGIFYESIGAELGLYDATNPDQFRIKEYEYQGEIMSRRDAVKKICMLGVYSSEESKSKDRRDFDRALYNLDNEAYECLLKLRRSGKYIEKVDATGRIRKRQLNELPRAMQFSEQKYIFKVVKELMKLGVEGLVTIHDCIKCKKSDTKLVKDKMEEIFEKIYGFKCLVNAE